MKKMKNDVFPENRYFILLTSQVWVYADVLRRKNISRHALVPFVHLRATSVALIIPDKTPPCRSRRPSSSLLDVAIRVICRNVVAVAVAVVLLGG